MIGIDDYRGVQWNQRFDAYCVSAVGGGTREVVLEGYCADLATETQATFEEAFNGFPSPTYVLVDEVAGGVVVLEHGWKGVQDDVVRSVSRAATVAPSTGT